jgi:hypothetical protein
LGTPSVDIGTTAITAPGGITTPSVVKSPNAAVDFPAGLGTPNVDIGTTAITAPGGVTAPGGITTPSVVKSPNAAVDFPAGLGTPSVTIGTSSISAPGGVTAPITAPGGVTTPSVARSPNTAVVFPTGLSAPGKTVSAGAVSATTVTATTSVTTPGVQMTANFVKANSGFDGPTYTFTDKDNYARTALNYVNSAPETSDRRLKRNLAVIKDPLDKVLRLKGLYFNWIEDDVAGVNLGDKSRRHLGLIAQDVKEVVPEAVAEIDKDNKYLGVNYNALIGLLVEALREMHLRLEKLERDTRTLREAS